LTFAGVACDGAAGPQQDQATHPRPRAISGTRPQPWRERLRAFPDFVGIPLSTGHNAKGICQDFADDHGFRHRYQIVKRFVGKLRGRPNTEA
jgi:hypothetical protein